MIKILFLSLTSSVNSVLALLVSNFILDARNVSIQTNTFLGTGITDKTLLGVPLK